MRIIAGRFKSRQLKASVPDGIRPTSDKLRETFFNILGDRVLESVFLDAYSGVGGIGIEAISRGASLVCFVDRSAAASEAIRANLDSLKITEGFRILRMELGRALRHLAREDVRFDVGFLDPPYRRSDLYRRDLDLLGAGELLRPGALVTAEHSRTLELPCQAGRLHVVQVRRQGDSALTFYEPEDV